MAAEVVWIRNLFNTLTNDSAGLNNTWAGMIGTSNRSNSDWRDTTDALKQLIVDSSRLIADSSRLISGSSSLIAGSGRLTSDLSRLIAGSGRLISDSSR